MPFQKGKSGNPAGRPKEDLALRQLAKEHAPRAFEVLLRSLSSQNEKYRLQAAMIILERAYGKPVKEAPQEREEHQFESVLQQIRAVQEGRV